ncbi:MAG: hypothetical protein WA830_00325 [Candidatus Sulfotelmatobacter sp.]
MNLIFDNAPVYVEYGKLVTQGEYRSRIKWEAPKVDEIVIERLSVQALGSTAIGVGIYREKQAKGGSPGIRRWRF